MVDLYVSDANEWNICPLRATMRKKFTIPEDADNPNISRLEGLAVHDMIDVVIKAPLSKFKEGDPTSHGQNVTDEMLDFMQVYIDFISKLPPGSSEESFSMATIHSSIKNGRWDYAAYDVVNNIVHIVDGKFGRTYVDEYANMQLLLAAEGYVDKYKINTLGLQYKLTIIQTRCYGTDPIRTWSVSYEASRSRIDKLRISADKAQLVNPEANPGAVCKRCPGRHACEANRVYVWGGIGDHDIRSPIKFSANEAAKELAFLEDQKAVLDARVDGLRAQIEYDIRRGETVDWYRMVRGRNGNAKWKISNNEIAALGEATGAPLMIQKPITPTQATKFIDKKLIDCYSERLPGSDKLERITQRSSAKEFAEINNGE